MNWSDISIETYLAGATILLSLISVIIAICSARHTSKQANKQIENIRKLSEQQLAHSEIYLATVMANNQHLILEMRDELAVKEETYNSGVQVMNERRNVMKRNMDRLRVLISESEKLQEEYSRYKQIMQSSK